MLAYDNVTNTAQEKLFSIHLVLAALLAAPNPKGRVLILDELADSLGAEHRREVLDAIATVAREHGITILATCQDAIMSEASPHCKEILYFHYPSKSEALNRPTRMFGVDPSGDRVELTAEALTEGRNLLS
jgi:ABC-type hemin transport system ATPase subunit